MISNTWSITASNINDTNMVLYYKQEMTEFGETTMVELDVTRNDHSGWTKRRGLLRNLKNDLEETTCLPSRTVTS